MSGRQLMRRELDGVAGPVVVIDVILAFTTAAYASSAGAAATYLVATVEEALNRLRLTTQQIPTSAGHDRFGNSNKPPGPLAIASMTGLIVHVLERVRPISCA